MSDVDSLRPRSVAGSITKLVMLSGFIDVDAMIVTVAILFQE